MLRIGKITFVGKKWHIILAIFIVPVAIVFNILLVLLMLLDPRSWKFNKREASALLNTQMAPFRTMSYEECKKFVESEAVLNRSVVGDSGAKYQVEVQMFWDRCVDGSIRVLGLIDDGRLRTYKPLSDSFIVRQRLDAEGNTCGLTKP